LDSFELPADDDVVVVVVCWEDDDDEFVESLRFKQDFNGCLLLVNTLVLLAPDELEDEDE